MGSKHPLTVFILLDGGTTRGKGNHQWQLFTFFLNVIKLEKDICTQNN